MHDVKQIKERILSILENKGPSLPVKIATTINVSPLFSSVFLSELYEDKRVKMSNMKVGSSSLYFLQGQEAKLEEFSEYLSPREKEALFLLKNAGILEDEKQTPVMRVALRAIKDFAIPVRVKANDAEKIVWKYFALSDKDFNSMLNPAQEEKAKEEKKENAEQQETNEAQTKLNHELKESCFSSKIKDYLSAKDIEIIETLVDKKKEIVMKVRIDTLFGKQCYYLVAKDKKKITETDLTLASQKAQLERMPAVILSPGALDKKASDYLSSWKNIMKFEKLNF